MRYKEKLWNLQLLCLHGPTSILSTSDSVYMRNCTSTRNCKPQKATFESELKSTVKKWTSEDLQKPLKKEISWTVRLFDFQSKKTGRGPLSLLSLSDFLHDTNLDKFYLNSSSTVQAILCSRIVNFGCIISHPIPSTNTIPPFATQSSSQSCYKPPTQQTLSKLPPQSNYCGLFCRRCYEIFSHATFV